jgi:hypothetical protein
VQLSRCLPIGLPFGLDRERRERRTVFGIDLGRGFEENQSLGALRLLVCEQITQAIQDLGVGRLPDFEFPIEIEIGRCLDPGETVRPEVTAKLSCQRFVVGRKRLRKWRRPSSPSRR